jgi:hypothetical protein
MVAAEGIGFVEVDIEFGRVAVVVVDIEFDIVAGVEFDKLAIVSAVEKRKGLSVLAIVRLV